MPYATAAVPSNTKTDPVKLFSLRAWARAALWREGAIDDLHAAVDPLVEFGERLGLDVDLCQAIMSAEFAKVRG